MEHRWLKASADRPQGQLSKDLGAKMKGFRAASKLKKVALTMIANQLDEADIEKLKETFHLLDSNKDGTLTMDEIQEGMKAHNISLPEDLTLSMKAVDTDGSGKIEYTEFLAATVDAKLYMKKELLWSAFRQFDKDGDGFITKA